MDKFLQIRELKDMVCVELGADSSSLLSVVLTCRSFVEPGLDRLWRDIDLLRPLLACLPKEVCQREEPGSIIPKRYTVLPNPDRKVTPADLERFQTYYANRIRVVRAGGRKSRGTLSPEFMDALVAATDGQFGVLSPRLKTFRWNSFATLPTSKQLLSYLTLLVGPSVTSIDLPTSADPDGLVALTALRLPHLENVSLACADLEFVDKFLTLATGSSLICMDISTISDAMIPFLALLPKLEGLKFGALKDINPYHAQHDPSNPQGFQALRLLDITSDTLETSANFLEHLPPTTGSLRDLYISVPALSSPTASQAVINAIACHVNPATLLDLRVTDGDATGIDDFRTVGINQGFGGVVIDITPLARFTNLKDVFLHFHGRVRVTPNEVKMITASWTQLENLDLSGTHPIDRAPSINHTHLLQFAEGCPDLRHLGVPFDGTGIQGNETSSRGPFPNIETLGVCGSLVEYPSCLAAFFIRKNFPSARLSRPYPETFYISSEPSWMRWKDVEGALDPQGPQVALEDRF